MEIKSRTQLVDLTIGHWKNPSLEDIETLKVSIL
jgi:hypothetical protein